MNAVSNFYNDTIFDAAFEAGCNYLDMAMSDYGANMGSHQWAQAEKWKEKGLLAILGNGMDPGVSDIFAKYASLELFDEIDEIGIRDGAALEVSGYEFAPAFLDPGYDRRMHRPTAGVGGWAWMVHHPSLRKHRAV